MPIQGLSSAQIREYRRQLKKLLKIPIIKQKSEEWLAVRQNMITASDFAQALGEGKFGTQKELIIKKSQPQTEFKVTTNIFFRWGNLFEPVATDIYSAIHDDIKIHEFGLLKHDDYDYFGASPDGISDIGIMVEIKCPLRRKVIKDGDVPTQYYYQIQGQLHTCNLEVCDYFECEFEKFTDQPEELDQSPYLDRWRGVVIDHGIDKTPSYSPLVKPGSSAKSILTSWVAEQPDGEIIYWSLPIYNEKRVLLDKEWTEKKLEELGKVWDRIKYFRENQDKIDEELNNTITVSTEPLYAPTKTTYKDKDKLVGYAFRDFED